MRDSARPLPAPAETSAVTVAKRGAGRCKHHRREHVPSGCENLLLERLGEMAQDPVVLDVEVGDPGHRRVAFAKRDAYVEERIEIQFKSAVTARHHQLEDFRILERPYDRIDGPTQTFGLCRVFGQ